MAGFFGRNKLFIIVFAVTLILLFGGIFLFTKSPSSVKTPKVNDAILIPQDAIVTSGIVNGEYLPATSSAAVTIVEFGDYECPACGNYHKLISKLLTEFAGKVNFIFRNYPLTQHKNAPVSSYAVEAAGLQGKYWQMHDKVYETQADWSNLPDPKSVFMTYAKDFGLDTAKFESDMASTEVKNKVQRDFNDGNTVKITETPTFYFNGVKLSLTGDYEQMKNLIENAISSSK